MWIMPWLIVGPGVLAFTYFEKAKDIYGQGGTSPEYLQTENIFDVFYKIAMFGGIGIIFLELFIAILGIVWVVKSFRKKDSEKQALSRPWDMIFCPGLCIFGTIVLMFFIVACTYGQSV